MTAATRSEAARIFPTFRFQDADRMIDWLQRAFGFSVHVVYRDDAGRVAHAQLAFGGSMIMAGQARGDAFAEIVGGPGAAGGKAVYIAVEDPDALCARARAAGARIDEEPTDRDYGSREFICRDPEGNVWAFGTYWPKADEAPLPAD